MPSSSDFVRSFKQFRRILELNNAVIERMAAMERALGGEYVFDRAFLRTSVAELGELAREVIYSLNAIADDHYIALYGRFEDILNSLQDLLEGGLGAYGDQLTLPYTAVNRDLDLLVGAKNALIGEMHNSLGIATPDGFAITVTAYKLFMEENNLFAEIARVSERENSPEGRNAAIQQLFDRAALPTRLETEIRTRVRELCARQSAEPLLAVRSSAVGEDGQRSFAGQFRSLLNVRPEDVLFAYKQVLAARFSNRVLDYLGPTVTPAEAPVAVGVQEMIQPLFSGVMYTKDPFQIDQDLLTIAAIKGLGEHLVAGRTDSDSFHLERRHPFGLVRSKLQDKALHGAGTDASQALDLLANGLRRGSALLSSPQLQHLAETGMLLEKAFDLPQDVEWAIAADGREVILQSRPLEIPRRPPPPSETIAAELRKAVVLLDGRGQVAQLGIAAGPVRLVSPEDDPANFPVGAIAVCRYASPQLTAIVRKAGAIITDVGSPTGHLATIAREYRTPAIFGVGNATELLHNELQVTVDAEERRVYKGIVQGLVAMQEGRDDPFPDTQEASILRRMLRWIAPINLTDPHAVSFSVENCRTVHDIIRFCHEKAVETLIHFHLLKKNYAGLRSHRLALAIPLGIRVIDLGSGLKAGTYPKDVPASAIRSRPLAALLKGLLEKSAWDQEPVPFGLRDLFSSMSRSFSPLTHGSEYSGENLAIIDENYCNLSLRLGYHFNVIDSYLSDDPDDNYIYFRFVGGMAEKTKRERRVELIATILASLQFKVDRQGDLLTGKAKMLAPEHMDAILSHLGALIAFTRQLDVRMADEASVDLFFNRFLEQTRQSWDRPRQE